MDRLEYEKSLEGLSEETKVKLLTTFDELNNEVSGLSEIKKSAFKERDDYKKKLKALEDAKAEAETKAQLEQGKFKDLYEKELTEKNNLNKELSEIKPFKEKYEKVETDRRNELLEQLPEGNEELKKIAEKIPSLENLKEFVDVSLKQFGKKNVDGGRGGKGRIDVDGRKWNDLSFTERSELQKSNPAAYEKLYNERYSNK